MIAATVHFPEADAEPWRFAAQPMEGHQFEIRRGDEVVADWRVEKVLWVAADGSGVAAMHVFMVPAGDDVPF